nr:reverse transcriptase domain-containing protein [Tanacetum cinerariifolium]
MKENDAILKNMQTNMTSLTNSNLELKNMFDQFMKMNTASSSGLGTLPSNTITNPNEYLKGITTRSGTAYQGPTIPTTSSSLPKVVERETEVTKNMVHPINNESTKDVQPPVIQIETHVLNSEPVVTPIIEPIVAPISALKPNQKPSISYPSRLHDQKLRDKTNDQKVKIFKIFQDLNFNISFADALILMPKFGLTIKSLLTNKDKLYELSRTPLNEHCSAVLLKKLPEKLGDLGKFLIPCDFPRMDECLALAYLGASINLIPLSVSNKISLPELSPTYMTLELADRSISPNYIDMTTNGIDVIDMACEEYSQEVIGFFDVIASGNPTPYYDLIVSTSSLTLTLFGDSDFLLKKVDAFLALEDDPTSLKVDQSYFDTEGDILFLEAFLNDDPSLPPPTQGNYLPQVELKDLPPHLEYVFLEGDDKFPVIIAKDLSDEEKTALIRVLKSHKRAIAWKLSDIKGINREFCTLKILMEDNIEPAVQHQRRVNLKIHDVIKKEVLKLLDAGLIYPISDSPWVSPVHCVLKKGGFNVVENEENELIPTRLVTGWRVALTTMLKRCEDTNLCLNWEKSHFMVKEGIVLGHKISKNRIKVDKAKVDVIAKLPHPTTFKGGVFTAKKPDILKACHYGHTGRHHGPNYIAKKGINFKGPFSSSRGNKYILVAIDYLSKWVEAKALSTNNARVVFKFLKSLFARFGTPRAIISDRGTYFCNDQFVKVMLKYGVTHRLATTYHPQTSGQVEVSNCDLKRISERKVSENRASWSDKLDDALWAFCRAYKTPIGSTPYKLVYRKACHLPIKLEHKAYWALKHSNFDLQTASDHRKV